MKTPLRSIIDLKFLVALIGVLLSCWLLITAVLQQSMIHTQGAYLSKMVAQDKDNAKVIASQNRSLHRLEKLTKRQAGRLITLQARVNVLVLALQRNGIPVPAGAVSLPTPSSKASGTEKAKTKVVHPKASPAQPISNSNPPAVPAPSPQPLVPALVQDIQGLLQDTLSLRR